MHRNHFIELDAVYGVIKGMYCWVHRLNFVMDRMAFGIQPKLHVHVSIYTFYFDYLAVIKKIKFAFDSIPKCKMNSNNMPTTSEAYSWIFA